MAEVGKPGELYRMEGAASSAGGLPEMVYPKADSWALEVEGLVLDVSMRVWVPDKVLVEL